MPNYVIAPPAQAALPIRGTDKLFPVHRIYCIGRNYAEHAREMGHDPNKEPPFFFLKNPDNIRLDGRFPYPAGTKDVHFEIEMLVALKSGGTNIKAEDALNHVWGYGVGLDMTRRDLQSEAKKLGRPWEVGKAFEHSAPATPLVPASEIGHPSKGAIWLEVNGQKRQTADLSMMIWSVPQQIAILSSLFEMRAGDIIMSGTPAGVGATVKGDKLKGYVEGVDTLEVTVV
ncbi:MAG TPA: fumarylacetoacetate hydrolase family protein [Hyphomicrobiaceae bacterium]|nr:fumarylacetoacetate hydrolase family protein [Hyphomicrobiaceae bacterium]